MATLNSIQKSFATMDDVEKRTLQLTSLAYIKQLASMTSTSISSWNILQLFGEGDAGNYLITDKKQINKIFFNKLEDVVERKQNSIDTIEENSSLSEAISLSVSTALEKKKERLQADISEQLNKIKSLDIRVSEHLKSIVDLRKECETLEGNDPTFVFKKEISSVLQTGAWINPVIDGGWLYLTTATNIVMSHKNKAANIDLVVDLGRFAVKIMLSSLSVYVVPYKYNRSAGTHRHYHPHVSEDGMVCWGNAQDAARKAAAEMKIEKLLNLLHAVLTTYNDENPYESLYKFSQAGSYRNTRSELKHPEKF